jgi:hypothetical protein
MMRSGLAISGALFLSAAFSMTLAPNASAQSSDAPAAEAPVEQSKPAAPEAPAAEAPSNEASNNSNPDDASVTPVKNLESIPADGLGDTAWLSGATRIVREITLKRPNEDLVICIAGCVEKQDRVVYAQPAEIVSKKPDETMSDAGPAAPAAVPKSGETPAAKPPAGEGSKPAQASEPVKSAVPVAHPEDTKPAIGKAATAAEAASLKTSEFEPSMSAPQPAADKPAIAPTDAAPKLQAAPNAEMPPAAPGAPAAK